jgi:tRNA nucleotidyltransferase (CCA-adding enzyme)
MVRMRMAVIPIDSLPEALGSAYPELNAVREASEAPVYLVGGAVRDLLLGRGRSDIDLVVVGDAAELATRLGGEAIAHERFGTAKAQLDGHQIDIATARAESYAHPGALPEIEPAGDLETDLARRDFTINAMAVPLHGESELIDPHGGRADLEAGLLRVLHARSFEDDPIRALRAARYAARFGFRAETETEALLRKADLGTVSADRRQAELRRLAAERGAARGFELLAEWGLVETRPGGVALAARVAELLSSPPWQDFARPDRAVLAAAIGDPGVEEDIAAAQPERPSLAVELASGRDPVELTLARALGAEWLDRYLLEWRSVRLEIDGEDLVVAGIPQGPEIGRGLDEALRRKLDGELSGREEELAAALAAARGSAG